jgi:hypothetical protein
MVLTSFTTPETNNIVGQGSGRNMKLDIRGQDLLGNMKWILGGQAQQEET